MQGMKETLTFVFGTPGADQVSYYKVKGTKHVDRVQSNQSNAGAARLLVGISTDTDSILTDHLMGVSGTPVVKQRADFATTNPTGLLADGDILVVTVDHNGNSGTAGQNIVVAIDLLDG